MFCSKTISLQIELKKKFADTCFPKSHTDASPTLPLADRPFSACCFLTYPHLPATLPRSLWFIISFLIDGNSEISRLPGRERTVWVSYWRLACDGPRSRSLSGSACMTSQHRMRLSDLPPGALRHWVIVIDHAESTGLPPLRLIWLLLMNYVCGDFRICRIWWIFIFR